MAFDNQYNTKEEAVAAITAKPRHERTLSEVVYLLEREVEDLRARIVELEKEKGTRET